MREEEGLKNNICEICTISNNVLIFFLRESQIGVSNFRFKSQSSFTPVLKFENDASENVSCLKYTVFVLR